MQWALEAGVRQIIDARRSRTKLISLPEADQPGSMAEAYAMQRLASDRWGDLVAGWKVGATAKSVQELFGISTPLYGPVFRETASDSPAKLPANEFQQAMVESEFGFIFGKTLAPRRDGYSREEVLDAVEAVVPALEIVATRFARLPPVMQIIADFGANAGAVLGMRHTGWRSVNFASHDVILSVNGNLVQRGTGALALGGPLNAVDWLVNTLSSDGISVEKGQFVLTGTVTGMHALVPGELIVADFGPLGRVELVLEP